MRLREAILSVLEDFIIAGNELRAFIRAILDEPHQIGVMI